LEICGQSTKKITFSQQSTITGGTQNVAVFDDNLSLIEDLPPLDLEKAPIAKSVEEYLNGISYANDPTYIPSPFALEFINFIKLVNGEEGEENDSPVIHYHMLDQVVYGGNNIANMCARGLAKTTLLAEYLFLYIACFGSLPEFGDINLALYVSDSIENGVKNMRKNLEFRWENSEFLKKYIPNTRFTDIRWEFTNLEGHTLVVKGYGAKTGVRGTKEMGIRPQLAILDDLVSDEDARSATVISSIEDTVYKAVNYALHPTKYKIIWSGTPFNARDPLYKAVESGAWAVNVYPICEEFPCAEEDFRGAWGDRFTYQYVVDQYRKAQRTGKIDTFNQELMLRIMSEEDRMILDSEIVWYDRDIVLTNKGAFNFYITTDFATSERTRADYSVISVWAYNNNGDWLWVDGICKKQQMDKNINDLFRLVQEYSPQQVGVEISGQQKGFISWIQSEMGNRNCYFTLAQEKNSNELGLRPNTNKIERFNVVAPLFKLHKIWFPKQLRNEECMMEAMDELRLLAIGQIKSKHDDFLDTISMLGVLTAWKPSQVTPKPDSYDKYWDDWDQPEENTALESYLP
jgi:phage terminase large subunit-like protein